MTEQEHITMGAYQLTPRIIRGIKLYAPEDFWRLSEEEMQDRGYGCGPGGLGDKFVPDTMWGLCVWWCCAIHDHMYRDPKATTRFDKWVADVSLLTNLNDWIEGQDSWSVTKVFRRYRAMTYFTAVRDGGNRAFSKGKGGCQL